MRKKDSSAIGIYMLIVLLFAAFLCSCNVSKKIDKSVIKSDSSSVKSSTVDSTEITFDVTESENTTVSSTETESTWEPHQVDSGEGIIIGRNGTAEDFIEILPANKKRKIFLPKNTKVENTTSSTKETKAAAKEVAVKKEAAEAVTVKTVDKQIHKEVKRYYIPFFILAGIILYLIAAIRFRW